MNIEEVHRRLAEYIKAHPDMTYKSIADKLGISVPTVSRIALKYGIRRRERYVLSEALLAKLVEDKPEQE
jgi:DNA-binding MurR/RpiR family transcriptional regulator